MKSKTTINLIESIGLTKTFKKIFNYFSIFTIVLGSTFGTFNTANAAAITLNATTAAGPGTMKTAGGDVAMAVDGTDTLNIVSFATTLTLADDAANQIFGAITGTTGTLTLTTAEDSHASSQTVASYVGVDGDVQITTAGDQDHTVIFTGDVSTGAITGIITIDGDAGDATATLVQVGGDITGVVKMDKNSGTATLELTGTNATINQSVDGLGDAEGRLKISGAGATMAGKVGTTGTTSLALIDVDATATFADTSEATTYTVDADTTFTGAVLANTAFTVNTSADVTLTAASDLSLATVTTGTVTSSALLTTSDLINTAGKVYLEVKNNEMGAGRYAAGNGAELHVGKAFVSGDVIYLGDDANGGATDFHAGSKIYLPSNFSNGETLKMTDAGAWDATSGDAATAAAAITVTLQDTALVDYTATAAIGDTDIVITAANKTTSAIATELKTTSNNATAALQLMTAMDANDTTGDTAAYTAFHNALNAQSGLSATEDTAIINQASPQTDLITGSSVAAQAVTGSIQGIMSNRMASLRSGDAYFGTGVAAGGMSAQSGFIQVFGSTAEQKKHESWFRNSSWF